MSLRSDIAETLEALAIRLPLPDSDQFEYFDRFGSLLAGADTLRWCDERESRDEESEDRDYEDEIAELQHRLDEIRGLVDKFVSKTITPANFRDRVLAVVG